MKIFSYTCAALFCLSTYSTVSFAEPKVKEKKMKMKSKTKKMKKKKKPVETTEEGATAETTTEDTSKTDEKSYIGAYGMAGCGLGSLVIKSDGFLQVFAVTLNGTGYQTVGMTVGTSNCTAGTPAETAMEQKVFVETNLVSLTKESAQGQGQHLAAFAELLGCEQNTFAEVSQAHFSDLYQDNNPENILQRYTTHLSGTCKRVG